MRLSALRPAFLRNALAKTKVTEDLRRALAGEVIALPPQLDDEERDEILEILALCLDWPVHMTARAVDLLTGHLCVLTDTVFEAPASVSGAVVVYARRRGPGQRRLDAPRALWLLRDALIECLGRHYSGTRMQRVVSWAGQLSDSPATALRFVSGALAQQLRDPSASEPALFAAGLASTVGWLLRGVDPRVAQWVLARALAHPVPKRLVSPEAQTLGEDAALLRAFEAGLVESLANEEELTPLDLRRPLGVLGRLAEAPVAIELPAIAGALRGELEPETYRVLDRLINPLPAPLGLVGPKSPRFFVGREEVVTRLLALFEPSVEIRTGVLYGISGIGKTAVAAAVAEQLSARFEAVWLRFLDGAPAAWARVADALGIEAKTERDELDQVPPRWVKLVHDRLKERPYLLVIEDAESVPEEELPRWLPSGEGQCAMLVLSQRSERWLQQEHSAVAIRLDGLHRGEGRLLLASHAQRFAEEIGRGEADRLIEAVVGHPGALVVASTLLEQHGLEDALAAVERVDDPIRGVLSTALEALDERERALLAFLGVCAPVGSLRELPLRMFGEDAKQDDEAILERLLDRSLVESSGKLVRLHALLRRILERELKEQPAKQKTLEHGHAAIVDALMKEAQKRGDIATEDALYADMLLALERMTTRCGEGNLEVAKLVARLSFRLRQYPRGDHLERSERVLESVRAALAVVSREEERVHWAGLQNLLAVALLERRAGNRAENVEQAIAALEAALMTLTPEQDLEQWSSVFGDLAFALSELPTGDREANIRKAISIQENLLAVIDKTAYPGLWGNTQLNLGKTLASLPTANPQANLTKAIQATEAALTVLSRDAYPREWALCQHNLGVYLTRLPAEDASQNLTKATEAFNAALTVYTRDAMPFEWARTQQYLGQALGKLPPGDRAQNLRRAIEAIEAALSVYTADTYPNEHSQLSVVLWFWKRALAELEAASAPPARPKAPAPPAHRKTRRPRRKK